MMRIQKTLLLILLALSPLLARADETNATLTVTQGYATAFEASAEPALAAKYGRYDDDRLYTINDVALTLYRDRDNDGYFSAFELVTDVDVEYGSAEVWLEVWIRPYGGYYQHLRSSDSFIIEGAAAADTYIIDASLDYDIPADYYDLMVELHSSTAGNRAVDVADEWQFRQLGALPLESTHYAAGAGAAGPLLGLLSGGLLLLRRRYSIA
ncbi:choice-of-anchor H family protein [Granulosicoccaceae sp. 1_MG-2023]|nr:choice-of-anchor H family protein [Granulosicoccaceae sp. 1_MG-2023]